MTNQEFANLFAMAQSIPGPNMILMMSFVGWKVWGFPGAVASAFATFGRPCTMYFAALGNAAWARVRVVQGLPAPSRARSGCDGRAVWRRHSRNRRVARAAGPL
jgi:hypothetical protein